MNHASASPESTLADLVSLWQRRRAEGQAVTPDDLCRDCPTLLPELQKRIAALERMDDLAAALGETAAFDTAVPPSTDPGPTDWPHIPGYEIVGELGRGGMGVVYRARDTNLERTVAIKMVLAGACSSQGSLDRFRAEAEAIARLQHPHVVQVFSWGECDGLPYLIMEFVAGGGLDRRIARQPQPPADSARLVMVLARAVHAAHKAGIVHRDLKPANVLLAAAADEPALNTAYGWPKIGDFGLARLSGGARKQTASFDVLGTPSYMAPEQAAGSVRDIGPAVDIYALGAILYEMLTGCPPFQGESLLQTLDQVRNLPPRPPRERYSNVPPELEAICLRCLAKSPQDRPATAADLAEDLRHFLDGQPATFIPATPAAVTQPKRFSRRYGIAAMVLLLAGAIGLTALIFPRSTALPEATQETQRPETAPTAPAQVRIERLTVRLFDADGKPAGVLGADVFAAHTGDVAQVKARLSRPAFAYVIVFRPDGASEVCFPEKEDEPPSKTDTPGYPLPPSGGGYGLDEGTGLQAFALVVSSQPLPAFKDWRARGRDCPWKTDQAPSGVVYRANGEDAVEVLTENSLQRTRGKGATVKGETPIAQLALWLRKMPGIETVQVLGFAVKEQR